MSAATEFAPVVYIPPAARQRERPLAEVIVIHRPSEQAVAAPLRLTRRGIAVIAAAVALLAVAMVSLASMSAPSHAAPAGSVAAQVAAQVTVSPGDTLWSIATRVAPNADPRAEIAHLQKLNHLAGVELATGEVLRTR